jgi:hypothetical protein
VCWLDWLNRNGVAVTAIVTANYAVFTVLLWLDSRRYVPAMDAFLDSFLTGLG